MVPSGFHPFGPMKNASHGRKCRDGDNEVIEEVMMWLRQTSENFYLQGIKTLISRRRKVVENDGDYVENYNL
jgi:hypothetical protein